MSEERFSCILCDPPWSESGGGRIKRGAQVHYPLMKTKDIIAKLTPMLYGFMGQTPAGEPYFHAPAFPVADNAHLWIFSTNNYLEDGLEVMRALGFRYVTNVAWAKMEVAGGIGGRGRLWLAQRPGLGQYLAGQHELLLFGVRGKLPARWKDKTSGARRQGTLLCAPRREHSRKPDETYDLIENVSPGPRLELFARGPARAGWEVWGNEAQP